jgi:hypothetical protein
VREPGIGGGQYALTQPTAKIKPDAANAWLPQRTAAIAASPKRSLSAQPEERRQPAAGNCEKSGLALRLATKGEKSGLFLAHDENSQKAKK